ncbi:MAG: hypothetical protein EDX89_07660 [Acidobacteria bacterium]|nr:MAG: hypothetical protein EDX89_07660 [Acidobacteriota bacterium]
MGRVIPFPSLSEEALDLLERVARLRGESPAEVLEKEVRRAAREAGLLPEDGPAEGANEEGGPFLALEATEEVPAIGPEGRGRRVHLKAIDETGEWDAGEIFVPDPPRKDPA